MMAFGKNDHGDKPPFSTTHSPSPNNNAVYSLTHGGWPNRCEVATHAAHSLVPKCIVQMHALLAVQADPVEQDLQVS